MSHRELRPPTPEDPEAERQDEATDFWPTEVWSALVWGIEPQEHIDTYMYDDYNAANDIDQ